MSKSDKELVPIKTSKHNEETEANELEIEDLEAKTERIQKYFHFVLGVYFRSTTTLPVSFQCEEGIEVVHAAVYVTLGNKGVLTSPFIFSEVVQSAGQFFYQRNGGWHSRTIANLIQTDTAMYVDNLMGELEIENTNGIVYLKDNSNQFQIPKKLLS